MDAAPKKGLAGKARRARERNRASRMGSSQLLDDYYAPDADEQKAERYIPIRHERGFNPSAEDAQVSNKGPGRSRKAIVKSGADSQRGQKMAATPRVSELKESRAATALCFSCTTGSKPIIPAPRKTKVIVNATPKLGDPTFARAAIYGRRETFRWGGFMYGCVMGTAAASVLLVIVRGAIG